MLEHCTVLLDAAVDALVSERSGVYVDATFGRGGHSSLILERLDPGGQLYGVDKDMRAIEVGQTLARADERFQIRHGSFAEIDQLLGDMPVQGILADLGVSSPQLDDPSRGFSFQHDGPLDMRMNQTEGESASEWLARVSEKELIHVLRVYGEERFAKRIARQIINERELEIIDSTGKLAAIIERAVPVRERHKHPATRSFQAIRIAVNRELEDIKLFLEKSVSMLVTGGRLVVISFHSLEDRLVKHFMRDLVKGEQLPRGVPITHVEQEAPFRLLSKAIKPSAQEIERNPRARSAIMRSLERVRDD